MITQALYLRREEATISQNKTTTSGKTPKTSMFSCGQKSETDTKFYVQNPSIVLGVSGGALVEEGDIEGENT